MGKGNLRFFYFDDHLNSTHTIDVLTRTTVVLHVDPLPCKIIINVEILKTKSL